MREEVIHQPTAQHTHTVILLHGRDSTAAEFAAELFESQGSDERTFPEVFPGVKWIFPNAGTLPSARFGCSLSQWFDMHSTEDPHSEDDAQDLTPAVKRIQAIIQREVNTIGAKKVVLAGISQGCAVGIHALFKQPHRLAGFVGLSSWLPQGEAVAREIQPGAKETPIFLGHCKDDEVIAVRYGEELRDALMKMDIHVSWKSYAMGGHWLNEPQGTDDIVYFLQMKGGIR